MPDDPRTSPAFEPRAEEPANRPAPAEIPTEDDGLSDYLGLSSLREADLSGPGLIMHEEPGEPLDVPDAAERT